MCAIIGYSPPEIPGGPTECDLDLPPLTRAFERLMRESAVRGTFCYGIATPHEWTHTRDLADVLDLFNPQMPTIAHCRYPTSGIDSQPIVISHGMHPHEHRIALAFNGVIDMGTKEEFEARWGVKCETDNDGEIFVQRLLAGESVEDFLCAENFSGSFAGVWLDTGFRANSDGTRDVGSTTLIAARNERRPLWWSNHLGAQWYASTRDIFLRAGFPEDSLQEFPVV